MLWTSQNPPRSDNLLGGLVLEKVLLEYEGPRMFTARDPDGRLLLAYHCDEEEAIWRYIVVPFTERRLGDLEGGRLPIVEALDQPRLWLVDFDVLHGTRKIWDADFANLPDDYLPARHVLLTPPTDIALALRFIGPALRAAATPLSVMKNAAERVMGTVRKLVDYMEESGRLAGLPKKTIRAYREPPLLGVSFGSLEVSVGLPPNPLGDSEADRSQHESILAELKELLRKGIDWAAGDRSATIPGTTQEVLAILAAIQELTPSGRGPIQEIEIGGPMASSTQRRVTFTRQTRVRIRAAVHQQFRHLPPADATPITFPRLIEVTGVVEAVDVGKTRITLRSLDFGSGADFLGEELVQSEWPFGDEAVFRYPLGEEPAMLRRAGRRQRIWVLGRLVEPVQVLFNDHDDFLQPLYEIVDIAEINEENSGGGSLFGSSDQ